MSECAIFYLLLGLLSTAHNCLNQIYKFFCQRSQLLLEPLALAHTSEVTCHGCLILCRLPVFKDIIISIIAKGVCWKNHIKATLSEWVISMGSFSGTAVGVIDLIAYNKKSPMLPFYQGSEGGEAGMRCLWGFLLQPLGAQAVLWVWGTGELRAVLTWPLPTSPCHRVCSALPWIM